MRIFKEKILPKKGSLLIGCLVLLLDQISKFWVLENVSSSETLSICSCLNFVLAFNPGITFGLLHAYSNIHYILLVLAVFMLICLVTVWWWKAETILQRYATAIILFGALGNLVDRVRLRAVVDFIDFHIFGWHWYTFNLADSAIVLGVGLLLLDNFRNAKKLKQRFQ